MWTIRFCVLGNFPINVSWCPSVVFITILEKNRLLLLGRSLTCVLGLTHSVCILSCTLIGCTTFCIVSLVITSLQTWLVTTGISFVVFIDWFSSNGHQDTLIGKLPRTQNLIVHIISQNITEIVGPSIREWKYFMKNVDEDFKDVEETDFMDDGVRIAMQITHSVCILSCTLNGCTTFCIVSLVITSLQTWLSTTGISFVVFIDWFSFCLFTWDGVLHGVIIFDTNWMC
jgi:hypothetical protein